GQAYGELKAWETSLIFGRIPLDLPYLNANDTRMIPNTFEGVTLQSNAIENLRIGAGYIATIKPRDHVSFLPLSEEAGAAGSHEGVWLAGFRYNVLENFYLGAINFL